MADERAREEICAEIERRVDSALNKLCARHYDALTQEHQLTSRVADAIVNAIAGLRSRDFGVGVEVQDFPDKARGSLEHQAGADLYISTVLQERGEKPESKGMLAQAKWDYTYKLRDRDLADQVGKMRERTSAAYVWVYGPDIVESIPVQPLGDPGSYSGTPGQAIANSLRCKEGDRRIGRDPTKDVVRSLNEIMREIAANKAVAISVVERPRPGSPTPDGEPPLGRMAKESS